MSSHPASSTTTSSSHPKIGWIGLGSMGQAMAINLQSHLSRINGPPLHFYNRTESRGQQLLELGAVQSSSIQELTVNIDICFISVSDDKAATSIIGSILEDATGSDENRLRGKIIVDTSTVHPDVSSWAQRELTAKGASFIASPVFGASPVAREGRLLFVVAGTNDAVKAIQPFLVGVMARKVLRLGEDAAQASLLKTAGNFLTAGLMELVAESLVFAEKTGIGNEALQSLIKEQYGDLPLAMSKRMTEGHYLPPRGERPWSDLGLALKDVGLGVDCAERAGTSLPVAEIALKHLGEARQYGDEVRRALDSSSMFGVLRESAGLGFESDVVRRRDRENET
ncbi:NAD(P)-dependent oxidoreductase [Aspergillus lucknowensis]|uniref:3-hydroxyisobutyrate dehydrogenase n=1 Tax=Aspergillus lucknowensis TaxID=176173 RepID=A0ABR4M0J7_9EURO